MISKKMIELGSSRSSIRELFEFGKRKKAEIGAENVYDFSLGNPNALPPAIINNSIKEVLEVNPHIHGYTSAPGIDSVRDKLAQYITESYDFPVTKDELYLTCGAAASLTITFKALTVPGNEYIVISPFFPEYKVFIEGQGGKLVIIPSKDNFHLDLKAIEEKINENTKAVLINSPNNPTGVVYTEEEIIELSKILEKKSREYEKIIYLISDEPYREVIYKDVMVPFVPKYYNNTIVCYSFSKSLSLAGERIGYILFPKQIENQKDVAFAIAGAGRVLGFVNAPALFQAVIERSIGQFSETDTYKKNRDLLYNTLIECGFECENPSGAFYLFPKALIEDSVAFCEKAKEFNLLIVPGDDFYAPGYVRLSYCVDPKMVERSLPAFRALAESIKNER